MTFRQNFLQFSIKYLSLNIFHTTLKYQFYNMATYSIENIKINKVTQTNTHSVDKKI